MNANILRFQGFDALALRLVRTEQNKIVESLQKGRDSLQGCTFIRKVNFTLSISFKEAVDILHHIEHYLPCQGHLGVNLVLGNVTDEE